MRKILIIGLTLVIITLLAGCGAIYSYKKVNADGSWCEATVSSFRDIEGGGLGLDKDCALVGQADSLKNSTDFVKFLTAALKAAK